MTPDWQMTNAQKDLNNKRNGTGLREIGSIAATYQPGTVWEPEPEPIPQRAYRVTPLADFSYGHLNQEQAARLRRAVDKARTWMTEYPNAPGLSFVIAGPVGTGKTTIAENLMQSFTRSCRVTRPGGDDDYNDRLRGIIAGLEPDDPIRTKLEDLLRNGSPDDVTGTAVDVMDGMLVEATELMRIVGAETPLDNTFGRCKVIIIDDAGSEEIEFSNERTEVRKRHARYGRFMDYCYRKQKHVIVTSMDRMLVNVNGNHGLDGEFVNIFGQKAFSRLYQMAGGFMIDLNGLPDYRPFLIG